MCSHGDYFLLHLNFSCQQARIAAFLRAKNNERKCSSVFCSFEQQITMKNFETVSKTDLALLQ